MVLSAKDYYFFMRDYGSAMGILHQQMPIRGLEPQPYREIIMATEREGATTEERLAAIKGPEV